MTGAIAGFVGAVLIDLYLLITLVAVARVATVAGFYQYVASGALGKTAYANPNAVLLGVVLHVAVGIAWAIGYAYVAARTPQVRERPAISGAVFGILVMIAMQLIEVYANIYVLPNSALFFNGIVAHVVFYGWPVAYLVRRNLPA
ncbi:MAG: hypothetical protein PVSMB8_08560 [Vulcanimicrobiaceae bacterium]